MHPLPSLTAALRKRLASQTALRLRPARLRQIEVRGDVATLTMGWQMFDGSRMIPDMPGDTSIAGGYTVSIDTDSLPSGIKCTAWSAILDTQDWVAAPDQTEIMAAALILGNTHVDRGDGMDGVTIYWLASE